MSKRRRSGRNSKQQKLQKLPQAAETIGFSEADEAFFSAGESIPETHVSAHEELSRRHRRPSFWRRLFSPVA
jgi:hypothetical protein